MSQMIAMFRFREKMKGDSLKKKRNSHWETGFWL